MTTKTTTPKNEGVIALLGSILKKSVELPEDVSLLANAVSNLADELKTLSKTVSMMATAIYQHSTAINEIFTVQEFILKQMKIDGTDTQLPDLKKSKPEDKPN